MSKSAIDPKSRILLRLLRNHYQAGLMADSISGIIFDPAGRPGMSNLLQLSRRTQEKRLRYSRNTQSRRAEKVHGRGGRDVTQSFAQSTHGFMRKGRSWPRFHEIGRKASKVRAVTHILGLGLTTTSTCPDVGRRCAECKKVGCNFISIRLK